MTDRVERILVSDATDVILAGKVTKAVVTSAGFDDVAVEEIAIVVHELASNIVKHAGEGTLTVTVREDGDRTGVEIQTEDSGPGIADVDRALTDGYSTAGSLGYGLGAVHRLMDDVTIASDGTAETGVRISAVRWHSDTASCITFEPISVGAASRAKPGLEQNGDAFVIKRWDDHLLVGVIDGLGHGEAAHRASQRARRYVQRHFDQSFSRLFRGTDRACRDTRGVVMALARFDWTAECVTLGSVGNISTKVFNSPEPMSVVARRGVIGTNAPDPVTTEREWSREYAMVMHSDGITTRWSRDEFERLETGSATSAAKELLRSLSTERDDATVLVVKEAAT